MSPELRASLEGSCIPNFQQYSTYDCLRPWHSQQYFYVNFQLNLFD
jgi:hypothetical protein